ncbi:MAG TPA: Fur family transcriptional regulator [Acidimicrobiia bacterium]|nr:Fur family transcriptional regulator [Acidimicrobiia bacterium]
MTQADLLDRATQQLATHNVRLTKARRLVLEALTETPGPRSAAELDAAMGREVPVSSIYRTLLSFETAQLVAKYRDAEGTARYEFSEWVTGEHHHHFVCTECGLTEDVATPPQLEGAISQLIESDGGGYHITGHRLELEGVCGKCQSKY